MQIYSFIFPALRLFTEWVVDKCNEIRLSFSTLVHILFFTTHLTSCRSALKSPDYAALTASPNSLVPLLFCFSGFSVSVQAGRVTNHKTNSMMQSVISLTYFCYQETQLFKHFTNPVLMLVLNLKSTATTFRYQPFIFTCNH